MLFLAPGQEWDLPDEIAQQLIDKGAAEAIAADIQGMEEKAGKKVPKAKLEGKK